MPVPIAASMTLEVIGLVLGTVFRCAHAGSSCTNLVMSVDKPSMRSSSRRQSQARSWMIRIMRSNSTSEHWARMPGNSVHRKPNQLGRKERIGQKRRRPAITDHHALHLCARASSQVIRSLATCVSRAMSEGGRSYLDRQPDVNKRSLAVATEPSLRLIESIRSRYLDQAGRVCRDKSHFISS